MAEIRPVLYSKELQKRLYPDNAFYKKSLQETGVADNVESVEKPVQGKIRKAKSGTPSSLPLTIEKGVDSKKSYGVQLVYCEPLLIDSQDEIMANYSKRSTKQQQQADEINTKCADIAATAWAPTLATNIIATSGAARATNVAGLTGNRKSVIKDDVLKVYNLTLRMTIAGGKWYMLATPDMYTDLLKIPEFTDYEKTGNQSALAVGIIGKLLNMEVMIRSTEESHAGIVYSTDNVKRAANIALEATDQVAALIWNEKLVCSAEGTLRTSINPNAPGYLGGTIIESWTRFGADIIRDDQKGVIALLESK